MCIPREGSKRWWHDVLSNLKRVAFPSTPISVAIPSRQKTIAAAFVGGALALSLPTDPACAQGYPLNYNFGTTPTDQEIAAVAIAIQADGKDLPPGKGDYA